MVLGGERIVMAQTFTFAFRIDWRRGPKELRAALGKVRRKLIRELAREIKSNAPHPSVAASVSHTKATVTIAHRAALIFEFGAAPHFPPLGPIREWAISVGKDPKEAYAIARSIAGKGLGGKRGGRGGFEAQPYIFPAIETVTKDVPRWMREIWEAGRR